MFQQVVYTRCKPRRELLNVSNDLLSDGKVVNEEGFAIHNFSKGILSDGCLYDPLYLETLLKKKNAAKEMGSNATGVFASYEYFQNENGGSFLGHEYLRPYNATDVRSNGQKHRPGNYIKQYLVGEFDDYPCLLFGSDCWTAHKETENFYYHDNNEPLVYLPSIDKTNITYSMTRNKVKGFIEDGRKECVKKLVAIVLSEMSKDIDQRHFIVIKDTPDNVELWVAAVEFSLPVYLAKQISFSTNVVATQNLSVDNVYYVDEKGKFIKGNPKEAREGGGKKRYYSMIVGIHPTAQGSSGITFGMNNISFILLDGETKKVEREDISTAKAYFDAVALMDEDIEDFDKLLEDLEEVSFGLSADNLFELFDGYKYLLDSASVVEDWEFLKVKRYLDIFKKYESAPYKWSQYLAEKVYGIYPKFYESDLKDNFSLLKRITSMDHSSKLQGDIEQYLLDKYMYEIQSRNIDVMGATVLNTLINTVYMSIPQLVADGVRGNMAAFIDVADKWDPQQSYYIFTKVFESNNMIGSANLEWHKEELNSRLIAMLFENICQSDKSASDLLVYVKNAPIYLELAVNGAKKDYEKWSKYIADSVVDSKLEMVCGAMLELDSVTAAKYEHFLVTLLKAGKRTSVLLKFIIKSNDKFGINKDSSVMFVSAYLDTFGRKATELKNLVDLMSENDLGNAAEELAYSKIDEFITTGSVDNPMKALAKEFEIWRLGLKKPQGRAYVIAFADSLARQPLAKTVEILDKYMDKEAIIADEADTKMFIDSLGDNMTDTEVYVKAYHLLHQGEGKASKQFIRINFEDAESVKWYLKLYLKRPFAKWANDYLDDIKSIEEEMYGLIKNENIDKIEKLVLKSLEKGSSEVDIYKDYFEKVKAKIKEDKAKEKQKAKESKKEGKKETDRKPDVDEKKGLFFKLFGKK